MFRTVREDIHAFFQRDPAARTTLEVLTCYPGLHAVWLHRIAHWLWRHKLYLLGRLTSHFSRFLTQIEIHPGARIGRRCVIDHGAGVVIGETAEVGDDALIYQGVVLGGTTLEKKKRHPTIGNRVVIGSAAVLLGPITVGDGALIGANSVVIRDVPPDTTVVGVPGRVVAEGGRPVFDLRHERLPDPVAEAIRLLMSEVDSLKAQLSQIEGHEHAQPAPEEEERRRRLERAFHMGEGS